MKHYPEETLGDWMIEWEQKERIKLRIACPELGYPASEARYASVEEWEAATGLDYGKEVLDMV